MTTRQQLHRTTLSDHKVWGIAEQKLRIFIHQGNVKAEARESCPNQGYYCGQCPTSLSNGFCQHRIILQRARLFNKATIPSRFINATMGALRQQKSTPSIMKAITWIDKWCQLDPLPQKGILLSGPHGAGKSFVMAAVIRWLTLQRGISCLFAIFGLFLMKVKQRYNTGENDYELFENLFNADVLILDDVGSSRNSEWTNDVFKTIIARRYNDCAITFLTTNLSGGLSEEKNENDFSLWAGSHSTSRLNEMSYWLTFDGPDRRRLSQKI
ncbi:ATP-binding protein [candidate division CSSED10-310 bacterium]|uniref:ATP-binding protein n=1 Tax=candidate division CSSED10-310 bacterium TaxID=2855610 RepID=A0ABV6Z548_UNCC1